MPFQHDRTPAFAILVLIAIWLAMLLLGAQFISMGFLAELFTAYYGRANIPYSIKDRAGQWPK